MRLLFSQRYRRPLLQKQLQVDIPDEARRKIWMWLAANNASLGIQRDPNDRWISNSSILEEAESDLLLEHGWDRLPLGARSTGGQPHSALRQFFLSLDGELVFDAIEVASRYFDTPEREALRQKLNQIFELHDCPWRMADGEFFKLDADFVGAQLAVTAHESLAANQFAGASHEYAKARLYLASGDVREAIFFAGHSFESVMSVLSGVQHANGDRLIKELGNQGFFDDLPEAARAGFMDQVLRALPFLRNKLGGHGQGKDVVAIPPVYGDLAIQIAAAFQNFLIAKHLERAPVRNQTAEPAVERQLQLDDEPPF